MADISHGVMVSLRSVVTYLDQILEYHRAAADADDRSLDVLIGDAGDSEPVRGFAASLCSVREDLVAVIAEIKRKSPSRGDLAADLDPAETASAYVAGGAACLSVLTDREHFGGSPEDLRIAREAVTVPVLRKDFTVDLRDVCDARLMGADAVLLIAAALDDAELSDFHSLTTELGMDALVEVHDEAELERVLNVGAVLVGVNQRDLTTFNVDPDRARRVAAVIPEGVVSVAESGVQGPDDAKALHRAGFRAVLVGESLVTSGDPEAAVAALVAAGSADGTAG
jgi:indole-3-glycerol phosphate synthase